MNTVQEVKPKIEQVKDNKWLPGESIAKGSHKSTSSPTLSAKAGGGGRTNG